MRAYGMPKGVLETKMGKFRWLLFTGNTVVLDNDPVSGGYETDYLTGKWEEVAGFPGSTVSIRGVNYSVRATFKLAGKDWQIDEVNVSRMENLPVGKGVKEKVGPVLLEEWQKFIALNPSLPHLAQRYWLSTRILSDQEEKARLTAALAAVNESLAGYEAEFKETQALVLETVNEVQKEHLDTKFED